MNVILTIALGWVVYTKFIREPSDTAATNKNQTTSSNKHSDASKHADNQPTEAQASISTRNTQRKDDASRVLGAAEEYIANNAGALPTMFEDGKLMGDANDYPATVELEYYKNIDVQSGTQTSIDSDTITLVTGASCNDDGSTSDSSSRDLAVMYGEESEGGHFKGTCSAS